jgi:hypothetical protein
MFEEGGEERWYYYIYNEHSVYTTLTPSYVIDHANDFTCSSVHLQNSSPIPVPPSAFDFEEASISSRKEMNRPHGATTIISHIPHNPQ